MVALQERCPTRLDKKPIAERLKKLGNEQRRTVANLVRFFSDPNIPRGVKQKATTFIEVGVEKLKEDTRFGRV